MTHTKLPIGSFLVVGEGYEPAVHFLSDQELAQWYTRDSLATKEENRKQAFRLTFRADGAQYALPAWSQECMIDLALQYIGPHQVAVRGIAAAIAQGLPWSRNRNPWEPSDGVEPTQPLPTLPGSPSAQPISDPVKPAKGFASPRNNVKPSRSALTSLLTGA